MLDVFHIFVAFCVSLVSGSFAHLMRGHLFFNGEFLQILGVNPLSEEQLRACPALWAPRVPWLRDAGLPWVPGSGAPGPPGSLPRRPRKDVPHRCSAHFDAVAQIRGEAFFFKGAPRASGWSVGGSCPRGPRPATCSHPLVPAGKYFWRLNRDRHLVSLQPAQMHRFWRGLPLHLDSVDAVYERTSDHKIVFFKGGWASPTLRRPH